MVSLVMKVIIDTNILFAGLYSSSGASHQILRKIYNNEITPVISTTLLFGYWGLVMGFKV